MNTYVIKSISMYKHLLNNNIYPLRTEPNIFIPKFIVWIYEDTQELRIAMNNFKNN